MASSKMNHNASKELQNSPAVKRFIADVAEDAATDIKQRADERVMAPKSARVFTRQTSEGTEVVLKSPIWHWQEFGAAHYPSRPNIRPSVQRTLSKVKGRFKAL